MAGFVPVDQAISAVVIMMISLIRPNSRPVRHAARADRIGGKFDPRG
jgi:hypothetical protein